MSAAMSTCIGACRVVCSDNRLPVAYSWPKPRNEVGNPDMRLLLPVSMLMCLAPLAAWGTSLTVDQCYLAATKTPPSYEELKVCVKAGSDGSLSARQRGKAWNDLASGLPALAPPVHGRRLGASAGDVGRGRQRAGPGPAASAPEAKPPSCPAPQPHSPIPAPSSRHGSGCCCHARKATSP